MVNIPPSFFKRVQITKILYEILKEKRKNDRLTDPHLPKLRYRNYPYLAEVSRKEDTKYIGGTGCAAHNSFIIKARKDHVTMSISKTLVKSVIVVLSSM